MRWKGLLLVSALLAAEGCGGGPASGGSDAGTSGSGGAGGAGPPDAGSGSALAFQKIILTQDFLCEGASFGDFNRDGIRDVVSGPYWYEGPSFATRHRLYPPVSFDPHGYSDCFFAFIVDFNGDGWDDVLMVGFPGTTASWLENPGAAAAPGQPEADWIRHVVVSGVDDESPAFADLTGDGRPELVFSQAGRFGWAEPDWNAPTNEWTFHPLSPPGGYGSFTHGLGLGDLNGDGRPDLLEATGYWTQPATLDGDPVWANHPQSFGPGGAQMLTTDVDGDGDADVVTSLAAHGSGLAWDEQTSGGAFTEHVIVPLDGGTLNLHEPHAVALADMNGDGLPDIVTGERFWGHVPGGEPDFSAPARLYWFEAGHDGGAHYLPHLIDDASGVGTQVVVGDLNRDGRSDVVVANKKGAFVFLQTAAAP